MTATYDEIGRGYSQHRRPDSRIAEPLLRALGDASTVVDIGAGTGSYEPADRRVVAVEPSALMVAQRTSSAPVVRATAESLPFRSSAFDGAMAVLTVHHWREPERGLAEMTRVAPRRVVLAFDRRVHDGFWLLTEYIPEAAYRPDERILSVEAIADAIGATRIEPVPIPHDCVDGFGWAYWRRPERYLDPSVRACISMLAALDPSVVEPGLDRLARDLASGGWHERHRDLLDLPEIDGGFRLIVADANAA